MIFDRSFNNLTKFGEWANKHEWCMLGSISEQDVVVTYVCPSGNIINIVTTKDEIGTIIDIYEGRRETE